MITFNHKTKTFQDSMSYGGKTLVEHLNTHPQFMIEDALDKIGYKLNDQKLSLEETVRFIDKEISNDSLFISCCYGFAKTILDCNGKIRFAVTMKMKPAMVIGGKMSYVLDDFYKTIINDGALNTDERLIVGLTAFYAGFMHEIMREFKKYMRSTATEKNDTLSSILRDLSEIMGLLDKAQSTPSTPVETLKKLDNAQKN